jgi:hypothetical protein
METKTAIIDGKKIEYTDLTEFLVQVGFQSKGEYRIRHRTKGNPTQACLLYQGINIGNGYKKRLVMSSHKGETILAKASS